jgi:hypothetical protein
LEVHAACALSKKESLGESSERPTPKLKIYGRLDSSEGYMIRDFLHRSDEPFEWIQLGSDEESRAKTGV